MTQEKSVYEQLQSGVRAIDLRLSIWNGTYYHSHCFMTVPYEETLKDLKRFVTENPTEVIVVQLND